MSLISVIIPTWNREAMLENAIRSALKQALPPIEVLICDDGSTDNSREIVRLINDSRVRWIEGEHSGNPAVPRNRGIKESQGEWIAFLDSDDEWLPEKLEKQLVHANKMGYDAVCSNAIRYVLSQNYSGTVLENFKLGESISFFELLKINYIICSSVLIKKNIVNKCKGFSECEELIGVEDYSLWLRAATFTNFAYINEPLLIYRDDPKFSIRGSISYSFHEQKINVLKSLILWMYETNYNKSNKIYLDLTKRMFRHVKKEKLKMRIRQILSKIKGWVTN